MKKNSMITKVANAFGIETEAQRKSRKRKEIFIGILSGLAASAPAIAETVTEIKAMKAEADTKTDTTTTTDTKTTSTSKAPETNTTKKETIHKVPVTCKEIFNFYAAVEVFCGTEKMQEIKFVKFDIEGNLRKL